MNFHPIKTPGTPDWSPKYRSEDRLYGLRRWLSDTWAGKVWYWLKCHLLSSYRFHTIDLRDEGEGYDYRYGWTDQDHRMWIACFKCLKHYVEREGPFEHINWDSDEGHRAAAAEIMELYSWWTAGRRLDHERLDAIGEKFDFVVKVGRHRATDEGAWEEWKALHDELERRDEEMLLRLIKVRGYLWT